MRWIRGRSTDWPLGPVPEPLRQACRGPVSHLEKRVWGFYLGPKTVTQVLITDSRARSTPKVV